MNDDFEYQDETTGYRGPISVDRNRRIEYVARIREETALHAKQQYADFVKAAMHGMLSNPNFSEVTYEDVAEFSCIYAKCTIEEMIKRGK